MMNMKIRNQIIKGYGIELRPIMPFDLPSLRRWRNSPRISMQMIDHSYVTPHQQCLWYKKITKLENQAHWVVWYKGIRSGYMNIKELQTNKGVTEVDVGMYVGDSSANHCLLGFAIVLMQLDLVFENKSVLEVKIKVREKNIRAIKFNKLIGYKQIGSKDGFVILIIKPSTYKADKSRLMRYFQ